MKGKVGIFGDTSPMTPLRRRGGGKVLLRDGGYVPENKRTAGPRTYTGNYLTGMWNHCS